MANHCNNYATLYGSKESIQEVIKRINKHTNNLTHVLWWDTFHKVLDLPINEENDVYELFGSKWFEVSIQNEEDNEVTIYGESAWSPMLPFWKKLSEKFNLKIQGDFDESGCDFGGFFLVDNGEMIDEKHFNYISYRYIEEGIDGVCDELNFYDHLEQEEIIKVLDSAKGVMSYGSYTECLEYIKELNKSKK